MAWYDILLAEKLGGGGISVTVDSELSDTSVNPVQNKVITNAIKGLFPKDTATGNPISIADGSNVLPVESCEVTFSPIQSGSGDPSPDNVRPISGRDSLVLNQCGKNLVNIHINAGDQRIEVTPFTNLFGKLTLSLKNNSVVLSESSWRIKLDYKDRTYLYIYDNQFPKTVTIPQDNPITMIEYRGTTMTSGSYDVQMEIGNQATSYEAPITPTTHTATFPDTIYGGSHEFVSGVATSEIGIYTIPEIEELKEAGENYYATITISGIKSVSERTKDVICECVPQIDAIGDYLGIYHIATNIVICVGSNYTVADFNQNIAGHKVAYPLATPQEITLTTETIELLKGNNVISTDGDNISLSYYADIQSYIDKKIAEAQ